MTDRREPVAVSDTTIGTPGLQSDRLGRLAGGQQFGNGHERQATRLESGDERPHGLHSLETRLARLLRRVAVMQEHDRARQRDA